MSDDRQLIEECRRALRQELITEGQDLVDTLAGHVCGMPTSLPVESALRDELARGSTKVSTIMTALVRCQQRHLEFVLPELSPLPVNQQVDSLKALFSRYAALQERWMTLVEQHHREQLGALSHQLVREKTHLLEERSKNQWLKRGQLKLFNYFRELQVAGIAELEGVDEDRVVVWMAPKLERVFAAGERQDWAYTPTPEPGLSLRLAIDTRRGERLILRVVGVAEHVQERRRHLRVSVAGAMPVAVSHEDRRLGEARILDFCESGLGLSFADSMDIDMGDKLVCRGMLHGYNREMKLETRGIVRWVRALGGETRVGLELELAPQHQEELRALVVEYEQHIIQDLRQLEVPQSLRT